MLIASDKEGPVVRNAGNWKSKYISPKTEKHLSFLKLKPIWFVLGTRLVAEYSSIEVTSDKNM